MLSRLAIRRRVTTMMITMMVFLAGIVSYMNLDMNLMPEMDIPIVLSAPPMWAQGRKKSKIW